MGRDFVELLPVNKTICLQLPERIGEHRIRDPLQVLFQDTKAYRILNAQFIKDLCFPLSLQHFE